MSLEERRRCYTCGGCMRRLTCLMLNLYPHYPPGIMLGENTRDMCWEKHNWNGRGLWIEQWGIGWPPELSQASSPSP